MKHLLWAQALVVCAVVGSAAYLVAHHETGWAVGLFIATAFWLS